MPKVSTKTMRNIAELARLALSKQECEEYANATENVLNFVAQISEVNTDDTPQMAHPLDLPQVLRADIVTEIDQHQRFQEIAPDAESCYYRVPTVIEEEGN